MSELQEKIKQAEQTLKLAAQMSEYYYHAPLIVCYSGGKDSDVMLNIAKRCLKPNEFEVLNSHTTVDAPETVYHIRDVFRQLESEGIHTEIRMPKYKGQPTSMWRSIEKNMIPPTRLNRYCCRILKEVTAPNRMIAVGVREAESQNRKGRDTFQTVGKTKKESEYRTTGHTYAMFKLDQKGGEDAYQCEMIKACKANKKTIVNPIYHFTDAEIWEYVKTFNVPMNPLYACGITRVGCIGCPFGGPKQQTEQFKRYPQYRKNYIRAFELAIKRRNSRKIPWTTYEFKTGEDLMRWWLGENPKQISIDELIKEVKDND